MDVDPFRPFEDRPEGSSPSTGQPTTARRLVALLEVLMCSDYPTQAALGATFSAFGYGPFNSSGDLRLGFVVGVSLVDTGLLIGLILFFLRAHGEEPQALFLGQRSVRRELMIGVWPLAVMAVVLGIGLLATVQRLLPVLHTVEHNPLEALIRTPSDRWWFALVVVVAGGFREEAQRAFLLHRFEQSLGGPAIGLVVSSVAFGAGHYAQGADAALVVGVLGAFWGAVYLRRRSIVAPVVSHSCFNLLEIVRFVAFGG